MSARGSGGAAVRPRHCPILVLKPVVIAVAALGLLNTSCGSAKVHPAAPPPLVRAAPAMEVTGDEFIRAAGVFRHEREVRIAFQVGGVISRLAVEQGQQIRAGQVLAYLDPTLLQTEYRRALVEQAQARDALVRDQALFDKALVSPQRITQRRAALEASDLALAAARYKTSNTVLSAPSSGWVLERMAQVGEVVQPGQTILALADSDSRPIVQAHVASQAARGLQVGDAAEVTFGGPPVAARVRRIGRLVDENTGTLTIELDLPDGAKDIPSGETAVVTLHVSRGGGSTSVLIPPEALVSGPGSSLYVLTVGRTGVVGEHPVRFHGFADGAAIIDGLAPGARVIVAAPRGLRSGQRVTVTGFDS